METTGVLLLEEWVENVPFVNLTALELVVVALRLLLDGLTALNTLNKAGILHRDLSPNNLLYSRDQQRWLVIDFDLARMKSDFSDGSRFSRNADVVGTEGYIAPEVLNASIYSTEADAFSLGKTVLYNAECARRVADNMTTTDGEVNWSCHMEEALDMVEVLAKCMMNEVTTERFLSPGYVTLISKLHERFQQQLEESGTFRYVRRRQTALVSQVPSIHKSKVVEPEQSVDRRVETE